MSRLLRYVRPTLFAFASILGAFPALAQVVPSQIHWTHISPTAVTFDWRGGADSLSFGPTTDYGTSVRAVAPVPLPFSSPGPFREAKLTGLTPNTTYHYAIGGGSDHTFTTAPPRGAASFAIHAVGDIGSTRDAPAVGPLQALIAADRPEFVLVMGDLTYGNTQGQASVDQHFIDVQAWSQDAAYMPAWGNHEWEPGDDFRNYKGRFDFPNPRTSPGAPAAGCCGEDWYWFDYGNTRFIAYPEKFSGAWADWFTKVQPLMAEAEADPALAFIVTFGHRPAYSSGPHGGDPQLAGYLDALGAAHRKYVLDLSGHEHNYQRSRPLSGVVHVLSGTGGRTLAAYSGSPAWAAFRASHHGSLRLQFSPGGIRGQLLCGPSSSLQNLSCAAGTVIDSFFIENPTVDRAPVVTAPAAFAATPGIVARIEVSASDPDGDALDDLAADLTELPPSASFTTTTPAAGVLTWTPAVGDIRAEPYRVTFTARNALTGAASTLIRVAEVSPETTKFDRRIAAGADDAEESSSGSVALTSSDLELVTDGSAQTVGVRFPGLAIPRGATITSAYIQFAVDEVTSGAIALTIRAQASDQAPAFTTAARNLSSRARTAASAAWAPAAWSTTGSAGAAQRTPDLSALIAEVTQRSGWASGNAMAFLVTGTGKRTAMALEGDRTRAPLLHVEYVAGDGGPPPPPVNLAPIVDAGPNRNVTLPAEAALAGTVSDDGLPVAPGVVSVAWSSISHAVTIVDPASAATTARFTAPGTYVLRLTANDGALSSSDSTTIVVQSGGAVPVTVERRIAAGADDAEESTSGSVALTSSDLELVTDGSAQTVGVRFPGLAIPRGATITSAYIQFAVDEVTSGAIALTIRAQASDQAPAFTTASRNLSSRARTAASAAWAPAAWSTIGSAGAAQRTPDLSALITEVTQRSGWASGNAMVFLVTGTGKRTAEAFEGDRTRAPLLHVEYVAGAPLSTAMQATPTTPRSLPGLPAQLAAFVVPSPLHRAGTLHLDLPRGGRVTIQLFDVGGRVVRELLDAPYLAPGRHRLALDPRGASGRLAAGVYFYRVTASGEHAQGRIVIVE